MKKNKLLLSLSIIALLCVPAHAITKTPAKDITANTTSFSRNLSAADDNVQKALETIDQLATSGHPIWGTIDGTLYNQTDLQSALDGKQDDISLGTTAQYFRGDLSLATFPTAVSEFSNDAGYLVSADMTLYNVAIAGNWTDQNIGIGTNAPTAPLHIKMDIDEDTYANGLILANPLASVLSGHARYSPALVFEGVKSNGTSLKPSKWQVLNYGDFGTQYTSDLIFRHTFQTTSPAVYGAPFKMDEAGRFHAPKSLIAEDETKYLSYAEMDEDARLWLWNGEDTPQINIYGNTGDYYISVDHDDGELFKITSGSTLSANHFVMDWTGNIGLGTNAPRGVLDVSGEIYGDGTNLTGVVHDEADTLDDVVARGNTTNYNVGIGTDAPSGELHIQKNGLASTYHNGLLLSNGSASTLNGTQNSPALSMKGSFWNTGGGNKSVSSEWQVLNEPVSGSSDFGQMSFRHSLAGGAYTTPLTISSEGYATATGGLLTYNSENNTGVEAYSNGSLYVYSQAPATSALIEIYGATNVFDIAVDENDAGQLKIIANGGGSFLSDDFVMSGTGYVGIGTGYPISRLSVSQDDNQANVVNGLTLVNDINACGSPVCFGDIFVQNSPALMLKGGGWDTDNYTNRTSEWKIYGNPVANRTVTSNLVFQHILGSSYYQTPATLSSGGLLTLDGGIVAGGEIKTPSLIASLSEVDAVAEDGLTGTALTGGGYLYAWASIAEGTPYLNIYNQTADFYLLADGTDGDKFKISASSAFSNNDFVMDSWGWISLGGAVANNKLSVYGDADITGNLGLGTITPTARLEIVGVGTTGANAVLQVDNSLYNPVLQVFDNGNVGIGSTNPRGRIDVGSGTIYATTFSGTASTASNASYSLLGMHGYKTLSNTTDKTGQWEQFGTLTFTYNSTYDEGQSVHNRLLLLESTDDNTASPYNDLEAIEVDIHGYLAPVADGTAFNAAVPSLELKFGGKTRLSGADFAMLVYSTSTSSKSIRVYFRFRDNDTNYKQIMLSAYNWSYAVGNTGSASYCSFSPSNVSAAVASLPTPAQGSVVYGTPMNFYDKDGNVGIGTNLPRGQMEIVGNGSGTDVVLQIDNNVYSPLASFLGNGNVGVGTTIPSAKFSVVGDAKIGDASNFVSIGTSGRLSYSGTARKSWTKYIANSLSLVYGTSGSSMSGLDSMADGTIYYITEASGTSPLELIVDFTNVSAFENCSVVGGYQGSGTHAISLQLYNWSTSVWDTFNSILGGTQAIIDTTTASGYIEYNLSFDVFDDTNYIGTGGDAGKVRFRAFHNAISGNVNHHLTLDEVSLRQ